MKLPDFSVSILEQNVSTQ